MPKEEKNITRIYTQDGSIKYVVRIRINGLARSKTFDTLNQARLYRDTRGN